MFKIISKKQQKQQDDRAKEIRQKIIDRKELVETIRKQAKKK